MSCQTAQEPWEAPRGKKKKKAVLIWWDFLETEWMFSKCSITCLTIFECYYQQLELKDTFFFLISAVHWRFYLNCSYKKLMKALSCWATKWQEWIPARWNLLKIQLSKHFCINISLSDSVHTHLQYRTRPGGGEFPTDLHRARSKARSWCLKGSRLLMVHTRSCLWSERKLFFQRKRPQALI